MAKRESYEERTEKLLLPVAQKNGVEIYDVEYVKEGADWYLRCFIDKEGGVSIDHCEAVSRELSDILDAEDFIEDAYILEVSSPGLGRQLKKDKHLEKSLLQEVDVKTYKPIDGCRDFTGILKAFDKDTITLVMSDDKEIEDKVFNRKEIATIKLALDF